MWDEAGAGSTGLTVPASYTDQIASILEREILRGSFRRGEHLQQEEICQRFGVSRTPAREALRKLQALGLVELVPNKGALIQRPTLEELRQTYEVRAELEGFAAALAAQYRTDEVVASLSAAQERLSSALVIAERVPDDSTPTSHENRALKECNDEFHHLIHAAGGNLRLRRLIRDLERYFPKDTVRQAIRSTSNLRRFYVTEHNAVLDEIINGRPEGSREAMREHIRAAQNMLLNYLREISYDEQ